MWVDFLFAVMDFGLAQSAQTSHKTVNTNSPRRIACCCFFSLLFGEIMSWRLDAKRTRAEWGNNTTDRDDAVLWQPKIRGFKWKDNGSWDTLCHYLTHSISFVMKHDEHISMFQLLYTFTTSFLAMYSKVTGMYDSDSRNVFQWLLRLLHGCGWCVRVVRAG